MRIGGIDPATLPAEELLVLPRGQSQLVFRAQGVPDLTEFHVLVREPKPAVKMTKDGVEADTNDPNFRAACLEYSRRQMSYIVVKSLEISNIEWDTVDIGTPGTWANWEVDLRNSGLSQAEINLVLGVVLQANNLDEERLKKARESFALGLTLAKADYSGLLTELVSTSSGMPADE